MMEKSRFPRSILGRSFPEGFVAGVVEERSAVPAYALLRAGIPPQDIRVVPGTLALEIDASGHPSLAHLPCAAGEEAASQEFLAAALLGDAIVGVRADSDALARTLARILEEEGVGCMHLFGPESVRRPQELAEASA